MGPQEFDHAAYTDSLKKERKKAVGDKKKIAPEAKPDSIKNNLAASYDNADTLLVKIRNGKAKIDTAKLPGQRIVFVLDSDTAHKLNLKITTKDTVANLRISQIIDSKENSDGPFGREVQYKVLEKGLHKIIVAESQMAGDPWGGKFTFEVNLKW